MQRIFLPVGQGAFYKEKIGEYSMVYDCGTKKSTQFIEKVIKNNFHKDENIDILFISHFHKDHISGIKTLKKHCKIKNVVLPFLHKNEKLALYLEVLFTERNSFFDELLEFMNFSNFFDEETNILIFGRNNDNFNDDRRETDDSNIIFLDSFPNKRVTEIKKGQKLTFSKERQWVYVPYNRNDLTNSQLLDKALVQRGINAEDIIQILKDKRSTSKEINEIRDIYKKVGKNLNAMINFNSMMLYSGPEQPNLRFKKMFYNSKLCHFNCRVRDYYHYNQRYKVGCIYTGDASLEKNVLKVAYQDYLEYTGTIQVPHHGSNESFDDSIFNNSSYIFPISFGTTNSYNHPSGRVISELLSNSRLPVFITEKTDSIFIQDFR